MGRLEISQGRRRTNTLVARVDRSPPTELREVSITMPEAITDPGFYSDAYCFLPKVVEMDRWYIPRLAQSYSIAVDYIRDSADRPTSSQLEVLFRVVVKPLHLMTPQIASASSFNSIKSFYAYNLRVRREPQKAEHLKAGVPVFIRYIAVQLMCNKGFEGSHCLGRNSSRMW